MVVAKILPSATAADTTASSGFDQSTAPVCASYDTSPPHEPSLCSDAEPSPAARAISTSRPRLGSAATATGVVGAANPCSTTAGGALHRIRPVRSFSARMPDRYEPNTESPSVTSCQYAA